MVGNLPCDGLGWACSIQDRNAVRLLCSLLWRIWRVNCSMIFCELSCCLDVALSIVAHIASKLLYDILRDKLRLILWNNHGLLRCMGIWIVYSSL